MRIQENPEQKYANHYKDMIKIFETMELRKELHEKVKKNRGRKVR